MSSTAVSPVAWRSERWRKLTRRDLTSFDDISTAAVLAAMDRGGVGRISSKGHAILRSPNGQTMSVSPNSNRSKQVVDIRLRKLFPVASANGESRPEPSMEGKAKPSENNHQPEATTTETGESTIPCTNKACGLTFATQGALYSHVNKDHVVCDEPGCLASFDSRRQMVPHRNIVHKGMAPRRLAKRHGKGTDKRGRALAGPAEAAELKAAPEPKGGGRKGFSTMSPERRSELASKGAKKRWENFHAAKAAAEQAEAAADLSERVAVVADESEQAWRDEVLRDMHGWVTRERQEKDEQVAGLQRQLEAVRAELAEANAKLDRVRAAFKQN